jgi:hypothetical protein
MDQPPITHEATVLEPSCCPYCQSTATKRVGLTGRRHRIAILQCEECERGWDEIEHRAPTTVH